MNKRDRKAATSKEPQPSPNRRDTKQLRLAAVEEEVKKKGNAMSAQEDSSKTPATDLLNKFDQVIEWKSWSADHNGWIFETTPGPTPEWEEISTIKRKSSQGFMKMDLEINKWTLKLKDGWRDIQKIYKVDSKIAPFGDKLSKDMRKDMATMYSTKHAKAFRCMMAFSKTEISILPEVAFENGKTLVPSSIFQNFG